MTWRNSTARNLLWVSRFLFILFFPFSINAYDKHIALLVYGDFKGEVSFAHRLKAACHNINWDAEIFDLRNPISFEGKQYDFAINLVPSAYTCPNCKNYLAIFHPVHHFFEKGILKSEYHIYDGFLLSYYPEETTTKKFDFPYMTWYPTAQWRPYKQVQPNNLFYIGCPWGDRYNGKFKMLFFSLDNEPFMKIYGDPLFKSDYPKSYQEPIPYDPDSVCNLASRCGITLVLHSNDHNRHGVPSGRIFESASASAVIICDENPFVQKHFKDSVYYINTRAKAPFIYRQIKDYMAWIKNNPNEALEKARRAHEIFEKEFLLEDQLLRLEQFHEELTHANSQ